jgi:hypothetical protein
MNYGIHWEVTFYGTGMSPVTETYDTEDAALARWDAILRDPYKGASSVTKVEVIRRLK